MAVEHSERYIGIIEFRGEVCRENASALIEAGYLRADELRAATDEELLEIVSEVELVTIRAWAGGGQT